MKPVIPLTRGHVVGLVKYLAEQIGKGSETKLPRGLVDSCIRAGATAAENAIEAAVNAALAPKSPEYFVPSRLIPKAVTGDCTGMPPPELCTSTCEATTLIPVKASAILESLTLDEPMTPSAAVAFLEELKTPTAEVCPVVAQAVAMADAAIAPLQLVTEPEEVEPDFPFDDGDDVADDNPFGNDDDAPDFPDEPLPVDTIVTAPSEPEKQLLSVEQFIALHKLNIVKPATTAGEWFCCRGDLDNSVLASKPAAEAAIRQGIIVGGDTRNNAVENYASKNELSFYA